MYSPQGHAAARSSRIDDLRKIYSHGGVDVNEVEPGSGQTPLMAAVLSGATESVKVLLLELNADPTIPEKDGYVRCHCYLSSSSFQLFLSSSLYEIYSSLISSLPSYSPLSLFEKQQTPPHGAGFQGRADVAKLLIERDREKGDCPIDAPHKGDQMTPLWRTTWGRERRHVDTGKIMIEGGANPNYLLPSGVAPNLGDPATPLQSAVQRSNMMSLEMLCAHGGSSNIPNVHGQTALHLSLYYYITRADRSQENIMKYLVEHCGANPNLKNNKLKSSYQIAREENSFIPDYLMDIITTSARIMPSDRRTSNEDGQKKKKKTKKKKKKKKKNSRKNKKGNEREEKEEEEEDIETVEL